MTHVHDHLDNGFLAYKFVETTLSYASIMGLQDDLKLKGDNYQWLGSMFYFGEFS